MCIRDRFTPDLLSIVLVVATQARGSILIHQKMFESRLFFVDKLIDMGAKIILCDPHRANVIGHNFKSNLKATTMVSPDIRAGISLLIAALSANGISIIQNIEQIDRGYEEIDKRRPSVDWRALAAASDGLVIYMGLHNLPRIAEELMAGGLAATTPVAVIQQGTVAGQRCLKASLVDIADQCRAEAFKSPSIVVVGEVIDQQVEACRPTPAAVRMPIPF